MKIEFYIPKDTKIPTDLRLMVDDKYQVIYKRVPNLFAYKFDIYSIKCHDKSLAESIIDNIVKKMIYQSVDHGSEWRDVDRQLVGFV